MKIVTELLSDSVSLTNPDNNLPQVRAELKKAIEGGDVHSLRGMVPYLQTGRLAALLGVDLAGLRWLLDHPEQIKLQRIVDLAEWLDIDVLDMTAIILGRQLTNNGHNGSHRTYTK